MDAERWQRVQQLFASALELEAGRRAAYLEEKCAEDSELRHEVLSLLEKAEVGGDPVGEAVDRAATGVLETAPPALEPGRRLGRYTVVERLGAGGMGEVYVAEDRELQRRVALKLLGDWIVPDATHLQRFRREARVLAALNHPNIVTIYSVEHEGCLHFLTMELVEGRSLDRIVPEQGLAIERFFDLAVPLARALAAAHEHGVTHRDLKPANVMLSDAGEIKVLDFGLAKLRRGGGAPDERTLPSASLTRTGVVMGTVPYMSPEQVQGEPLDPRSDIFSLGVMLYEMATGARPFRGDSSAALISAILKDQPPSISGLGRRLPPRLAQIIERCLDKEPERRYPHGGTLALELAALAEAVEHHPRITGGLARLSALIPRTRISKLVAVATGLVVLLLGAVGLDFGALRQWQAGSPEIASLAVLPLDNLTGDDEQEYLADGMTEVLITELSKIGALKVISRTSVMRFKDSDRPLAEVASELGVDAVVEGSVQRDEDRVGITARLIHAASEEPLWAERFERDLRDLLALQGEVARAIALQVEVTLTPEEQARLASAETVDPRAWEAYLRGRNEWNRFSFREAVEAFQEATALDPDFALAHAGLAKARQMQGVTGQHPPKAAYPLAKAAVARALELDDDLAEAHAVLGWTAFHFDWDWQAAEREFDRALELNPGSVDALTGSSYYLAAMGQFEDAVAASERARRLDPLSPLRPIVFSDILYYARQNDRALFELVERFDESFGPTYWIYDRLLQASGDPEAAAWAALRGARLNPWAQARVGALEEALTTSGPLGFWREMLEFQLSWPQEAILAIPVAESYVRLGEIESAFEWLDRAFERRDSLALLGVDPIWDPLRDDPRFNELLIRLRLPQARSDEPRSRRRS